jgi:hypothetical protein
MRRIIVVVVFVCFLSPAFACMQPEMYKYDRVQELAAIDEALNTKPIEKRKKVAVQALRKKVSTSLMDLNSKDIAVQYQYQSRAMKLLGLQRIPYRPNSDFEMIDQALANMKTGDEKFDKVSQLRNQAERQWAQKEYDAARAAISAAQNILGIKMIYPGC